MSKIWGWLAIFGIMGFCYLLSPEFFHTSYAILSRGDIGAMAEYIRSFGAASVLVTLLLFFIVTYIIVIPYIVLSGAAGIVYGLFWGTIIAWIGEIIGEVVMFILARYFFRQWVADKVAKTHYLKQVDDYGAKNGFKVLLIARLMPLAPSEIITSVAAISSISFRHYFWGTVIGKLPPVFLKVLIGHDIVYAQDNMPRLVAVISLVAFLYVYMWWRKRKKKQKQEQEQKQED
jgi:uncharacterized membrane protein YdjX (TVP38/TMEM64 family)